MDGCYLGWSESRVVFYQRNASLRAVPHGVPYLKRVAINIQVLLLGSQNALTSSHGRIFHKKIQSCAGPHRTVTACTAFSRQMDFSFLPERKDAANVLGPWKTQIRLRSEAINTFLHVPLLAIDLIILQSFLWPASWVLLLY